MSFFKNITFARGMILVCLVVVAVLAPWIYQRQQGVETLRAAVAEGGALSKLISRIQSNSALYTELYKKKGTDHLKSQGSIAEYVRTVADDGQIQMGRIDLSKPRISDLTDGIVDEIFTLTPSNQKQGFGRINIGNYLFSLEDRTRHLRVTQFKMMALSRATLGKEGRTSFSHEELPSDKWRFTCQVTSRHRRTSN